MDDLITGSRRFRITSWPEHRDRFAALANGQSPRAMIIGCCDSRVDPQMIFGAAPGELFVMRNVANMVPTYAPDSSSRGTSAALEYAVKVLEVEELVVLGHGRCGGVRSLLHAPPVGVKDFLEPWMATAAPACLRAVAALGTADPAALQQRCEEEVIKLSIANLMTFPWIRERVEVGKLQLRGCWFEVATGELRRLVPGGAFETVAVEG